MKMRNFKKKFVIPMAASVLLTGVIGTSGFIAPSFYSTKVFAASISLGNYTIDSRIRLNSLGFFPDQEKKATIAGNCSEFQLVRENGEVVYSGTPKSMSNSDTSEQVFIADFSTVKEKGTYILVVPGVGKSINFKISDKVYDEAYKVSMLGMYLMRCGTSVSATYNGKNFSHGACHTNDAYMDYINNQHTKRDGTKGWHDAGDYNKYVVNAGVTVGSMFMAWEHYKDKIQSISLTMPESSNSMPDFLDEMKWEIDWLFTMQYPDGSGKVSHKLTTVNFGGFIPPEQENTERFFTPWGTAATADFVGMMAMASRIFKPYDAQYADKCLKAAELSYQCLKANPNNVAPNQSAFKTGGYDSNDLDDRIWAAAEMWETTGESAYLSDFESLINSSSLKAKVDVDFDWGNVKNLGVYTYLMSSRSGKNQSVYNTLKSELIKAADTVVQTSNNHGYGRPLGTNYYWGCNGSVARQTMLLQIANKLSPKTDYLNTALNALGHLFGRNYYNRSFVTGLGINPPKDPHDRRSGGNVETWPGCPVGGAWPTAKDWEDVEADYETNEIAINWSGALIYAVAGFVGNDSISTPVTSTNPSDDPSSFIYGDVDGSGKVNAGDYTLMRRYILGTGSFTYEYGEEAADVNGDGNINAGDYTLLRRFLLELINRFPAEE